MEPFEFNKQLVVGDKGELDFLKFYKKLQPYKSPNREIDFFLAAENNASVELKTDTYDMNATGNFFMEILGDVDTGKIGGPWRAAQDKVKYFVYYFLKNRTFFWFESQSLMEKVDQIVLDHRLKPRTIKNVRWSGQGYTVPRILLESVLIRKDTFY